MERFIVYIPRWLRWTLLLVLSILVVGFSAAFFVGINQPGYGDWRAATVSVVQIALTGLAYVLIVFFTESGQSPAVLQKRTERVLATLLPQTLARITDSQGEIVRVTVGEASGVIGRDYVLQTSHTRLRVWVGLNVHRVIVILFCARPDGLDDEAFCERLQTAFADTIMGARAIGYDKEHIQIETIDGCDFASIWLTWDVGTENDFLTHSPSQLFFAQDVTLMVQSFLRTAQRRELQLSVPFTPMPL